MVKNAHEILKSERFSKMVFSRWIVSSILTVLLCVLYFGFIFLVAYDKAYLATKIGVYTNVGILFGVLTIVGAWLLTVIYVIWANTSYDKKIADLRKELEY